MTAIRRLAAILAADARRSASGERRHRRCKIGKARCPPTRDARLGDRNGRFGIMTARALLLGAVPYPNILRRHPQHPRQRRTCVRAVPHQRF